MQRYGDLASSLGKDIGDSGSSLLALTILMQAAMSDDADNNLEYCISASEFLKDENVRRFYYNIYGIRNLPELFMEKFGGEKIK